MFKLIRFPSILLLAAAVGCGEKEIPPEEAYTPVSGDVDTSLSPELQQKQQALKSILDALSVEGLDLDQLPEQYPGLRFNESAEEFYERSGINLDGWEFNGKPVGNDLPVVLYLNLDSTGRKKLKVERVYTVTGSRGRFTISRKP